MGAMMEEARCLSCKQFFKFDPKRVPSLRVSLDGEGNAHLDPNGLKKPICLTCMEAANVRRESMGLKPHPIDLLAYKREEVGM